jgi:hypothetical protein
MLAHLFNFIPQNGRLLEILVLDGLGQFGL